MLILLKHFLRLWPYRLHAETETNYIERVTIRLPPLVVALRPQVTTCKRDCDACLVEN